VHDYHQQVFVFDVGRFPIGTRFMVREFGLDMESPDSNIYTLADMGPGYTTVTLSPVSLDTTDVGAISDEDCGFSIFGDDNPGTGTEAVWEDGVKMVVGQDYEYPPDSCIDYLNHIFYGRVVFDLSSVTSPVASAKLTFTQGYSISDQYLYDVPCLDQLAMITSVEDGRPSGMDPYRDLPRSGVAGTVHTVDATDIVREWQLGAANLGFVLTPVIDAHPGDHYTQQCWTTLSSFQLTLTYFR
jgi:hypothetical protein